VQGDDVIAMWHRYMAS